MIRTGRFVIKKVNDGYMYELQASNYSAIAESPVYTTLEGAKRSIRSIVANAKSVPVQDNTVSEVVKYPNPKFEIFRAQDKFIFRFRAGNGKMTISSQIYVNKESCKNGIASVQNHIAEAAICIETAEGIVTLEEYAKTAPALEEECTDNFDEPEETLTEAEKSTRPGRFVIYQDEKGFRFELLAANFSSIADSPVYSTLDSAKRSIRSIKEYASGVPVQDNTVSEVEKQPNPKFEIFTDGESFTFRFRAKNGKQTISSQAYTSKEGCRNGVDSVQKHVTRAEVYIETEEGAVPIEEYTAMRVAIFNASVFKKKADEEVEEATMEPIEVEDTPVEEAPAAAPVEETPVEETPVEETPVEETPVEETPAEEPVAEVPVEEAPVEEAPAEEPVAEEPVEEAAEEAPAEEAPAEEAPAEEAAEEPTEEAPAKEKAAPTGSAAKKQGFIHFLGRVLFGKKN